MTEAAARLLIDEGFSAITHRKVADAAGVPQGSASYYFPSRAALAAASVRAAEALRAESATALAEGLTTEPRSAAETADLIIRVLFAPHVDDTVVAARLDPMLTALRDPSLRPLMTTSRPQLLTALGTTLAACGYPSVTDTDLLQHLVDAALLRAAATSDENVIERAASTIARYLDTVG